MNVSRAERATGEGAARNEALRILRVADVPTEAELELRKLKRAGLPVESRVVTDESAFRNAVTTFGPHVILSDFTMPGWEGTSALDTARDICPHTPFIFVSGTLGEEYAIRALQNGAADYVLKTNLVHLPAAVERAVREARERIARREAEDERDAARERLYKIFRTLEDVLWSVTLPARETIYVSQAVESLSGHPVEALTADPSLWKRMIHPEDLARVETAWGAASVMRPYEVDYRIVRADGSVRWVNSRARVVCNAAGEPERMDGVSRDVTESMQQRRRIARLSQVRDVSSAINQAIVRTQDLDELLREACRIAVEVGQMTAAWIGRIDRVSSDIVPLANYGDDGGLSSVRFSASAQDEAGSGIVGRAARSGRTQIWNDDDVARDDCVRLREQLIAAGVRAAAAFPIMVDEKPIGVFLLSSGEPAFFDDDEVRLFEEVTGNIAFALSVMARQEKHNRLVFNDPLTGLPNRTFFHSRLEDPLEAAQLRGEFVALMLFDIERFGIVNNTLGTHVGDRVLQMVARRLKAFLVEGCSVARVAGNRFAILSASKQDQLGAAHPLCERFGAMFREPFQIDGRELRLSARAGIAVAPYDGHDVDTLFRNAEVALNKARETGERLQFYAPELNNQIAGRLDLENRLRKAVDLRQFVLHYQPKVDLRTSLITGMEALIRWNDPDTGLVPPMRFIPLLEETGLIREVGRWAMEEAIRTHRAWRDRGLRPPRIAVNMSSIQLRQRDLVEEIHAVVGGAGEESGLDIEITESLLMEDIEESIGKLQAIRDLGIRIALDDFGTGYSSLSYLHKLPINTLKVDRSFVMGMTDDEDKASIVATVVSLAKTLRLRVVAEGVETEPQAELLRQLHCDEMQGYLFCRPMPAERIEAMIAAQ